MCCCRCSGQIDTRPIDDQRNRSSLVVVGFEGRFEVADGGADGVQMG